jgi:hypothetical protein
MISVALQLQVAIKVSQEDELTIASLLSQTEEAKAKELVAKSKAEEATSIVNQLNLEINAVKRKLNLLDIERGTVDTSILSVQQQLALTEEADAEVESMLRSDMGTRAPHIISDKVLQGATPFERWKMNKFLYSSDTPAASEMHDTHVVDMLLDAATNQLQLENARKPTAAYIAKLKRGLPTSELNSNELREHTMGQVSPVRRTDRDYFLSDDVEQVWGSRFRGNINANNTNNINNNMRLASTPQLLPKKKNTTKLASISTKELPAIPPSPKQKIVI